MEKYYKILRNGRSCHGGDHTWEPGVTYKVDEVIPCVSGFHACMLQDLASWITWDMEIWEIELGEVVVEYNKVVGRTAKLGKRLGSFPVEKQVEFAQWCAKEAAAVTDAGDTAAAAAAREASCAADWAAVGDAESAVVHVITAAEDATWALATSHTATREAQGRKILELLT